MDGKFPKYNPLVHTQLQNDVYFAQATGKETLEVSLDELQCLLDADAVLKRVCHTIINVTTCPMQSAEAAGTDMRRDFARTVLAVIRGAK